jgi:hypothetical protein
MEKDLLTYPNPNWDFSHISKLFPQAEIKQDSKTFEPFILFKDPKLKGFRLTIFRKDDSKELPRILNHPKGMITHFSFVDEERRES